MNELDALKARMKKAIEGAPEPYARWRIVKDDGRDRICFGPVAGFYAFFEPVGAS